MESLGPALFDNDLLEMCCEAPDRDSWARVYTVRAVLNRAIRARTLHMLRDMRWRIHGRLSCGMYGEHVPRSDETVEPIYMMRTHEDYLHIPTRRCGRAEMEVTDPFRWPSDTEAMVPAEPDNMWHDSRDVTVWDSDSDDDAATPERFEFVVVIRGQCPCAVMVEADDEGVLVVDDSALQVGVTYVDGHPMDLTVLPSVTRSCLDLLNHEMEAADFPAGVEFSYRRMATGSPDATIWEVWDAVTTAEGFPLEWDNSMLAWHFPGIDTSTTTLRAWFARIQPAVTFGEWRHDGLHTLHLSWPSCAFNPLHPHTRAGGGA